MMMGNTSITATRVVQKDMTNQVQEVSTEICVVGAGVAGVSAALEAARKGHKVVLVDGLPTLGGQAVNSIISTFGGILSHGPKPYIFTYGMAEDIIRDLGKNGGLYLRTKFNTIMYNEVELSRWIEKAVHKAGIKVITGAILRAVNRENRRIRSIDLATRYGDLRIIATGFVDSTGDAAVTWNAGLPCREPAEGTVYGTQVVVLEGINEEYYPKEEEFLAKLKEKAEEYGFPRKDGMAITFPGKGIAVLNMTHVETPLDPVLASEKAFEGKDQSDRTVEFLKNEFPKAFGQCRVRVYAVPGIRQTRWIVGRYQLTIDDIRNGTYFEDSVVRTAWPIELHNQKDSMLLERFHDDHVHYIPLRSLTPPDVDNLVAAGRCMDGDLAALSSVRVMGPCIGMGAAAAHALSLAGEGSVHEIDIRALQERLKDNLHRMDIYEGGDKIIPAQEANG
jgi:hypothetical protein